MFLFHIDINQQHIDIDAYCWVVSPVLISDVFDVFAALNNICLIYRIFTFISFSRRQIITKIITYNLKMSQELHEYCYTCISTYKGCEHIYSVIS